MYIAICLRRSCTITVICYLDVYYSYSSHHSCVVLLGLREDTKELQDEKEGLESQLLELSRKSNQSKSKVIYLIMSFSPYVFLMCIQESCHKIEPSVVSPSV
jgi:hypothetical protein